MAEAAGLRTVAVYLERPPVEGISDEARNDHAVLAALAWTDRVEEAGDDTVEAALLVVGEGEVLVEGLRVGIGPAAGGGRSVDATGIFLERLHHAVVAVHLGCRREQHALAEAVRVLEDDVRPPHVRAEGAHRLLDDEPNSYRGREVVDDIAPVNELVDHGRRQDRVDDEVEIGALAKVRDILERAGRQVIEYIDFAPAEEKGLTQVGTDKPSSSGHERSLPARATVRGRVRAAAHGALDAAWRRASGYCPSRWPAWVSMYSISSSASCRLRPVRA